MRDPEFPVRSFVAMGLGTKQTEEGFEALLNLIETDSDPNVIAEAANSLAKFGPQAMSHLVQLFEQESHWLIRQSIFAAMEGTHYPEILLKFCRWGFEGDDPVVKQAAIANLGQLHETPQAAEALAILCQAAIEDDGGMRAQAARTLRHFDHPQATAALLELRQDSDHRVVGATLEGLV
ncbi:MAG: HEAT repeat domain-containing protein [Cyanothece sp. SIO1E1]|nr:HEAT repeat domain-containing protein [Cyanothece sp. SIO1E1]